MSAVCDATKNAPAVLSESAKVKVYAVEANNQNFDRREAELARMA